MKKKSIILATLAAILGSTAYASVTQGGQAKPGALFFPENRKIVALGKAVYKTHCASCHGVNLEGQPNWRRPKPDGRLRAPPHTERGHTWHHTDDVLFTLTKYGAGKLLGNPKYKTDMPIYKDILSDKEIIAVLSFIKSTWPKNIREHHDQRNAMRAKKK